MVTKDKYLTRNELAALKRVLQRRTRDELFFELMLHTGARPQELLNLTALSLDFETNEVSIKGLKRSNDRSIPLKRDFMHALKTLIKPDQKLLFPVTYDWMYKAFKQYTPNPHKTMKSLRHCMGTYGLAKSKSIKAVQKVLGHKSLTSTMVYADLLDEKKQIKKVVNGLY